MVHTKGCIVLRERNTQNFHAHKLLKSGSNESLKLHIRETGPISRSRFKASKEDGEIEDGEFGITLRKEELLDHDNCTWLSSGGAPSPSSCCQYDGLFGYMDVKLDAWFISLLSKQSSSSTTHLSTEITFFDGSRTNPIEEASLVLDQRKNMVDVIFQEKLEEEEVVSWLETESSDNGDSKWFNGQTLDKRSKSESAYFEYDLATPFSNSVSSITDSSDEHAQFSSSSSSDYSLDYSSEIVDLEEISPDRPLFWPFNSASDWGSETKWDFFIMSPRKDIYKVGKSPKTSHHAMNPRVPNGEPDSEKSCNRRLFFGKTLNSSDSLDLKRAKDINYGRRMRSKPSMLKKSTKTSTKIVPLHNETDFEDTRTKTPVCESIQLSASNADLFADTENEHLLHSSSFSCVQASENASFEDTSTKTPVFWPSSCASGWNLDTKWDFLVMSPRKTSPSTLRLRFSNGNMDLEKGCSRRLEFSNSSKSSTKTVAIGDEYDTMELPKVENLAKKSMCKHKIVLEDLLLVDKLNTDGAIEQVLGLGEFDGHEGIESEFNKEEFSLVQIP